MRKKFTESINCVSVFGLGKVGVTLVAALMSAGYKVIGFDINNEVLQALKSGTFHTLEPGVMDSLKRYQDKLLTIAENVDAAIAGSQLSFVIVPTPSNALDGFSNEYLLKCLSAIGQSLRSRRGRHCVSVISTVMPTSSTSSLVPILQENSGRRIGENLGYCYNPSFIAQGEVMKGLIEPDYILIGEQDELSGDDVEEVHRKMVINSATVIRMTPLEAEITKIASNTHETMRVAFANMLLALCNELPGSNVDAITTALAHRIGKRFFKGAVPYGGPCWPRDNKALSAFMESVGVPSVIPTMVDVANDSHAKYLLDQALMYSKRNSSVGIIGLAYKPGTSMLDESFGVNLARWLAQEGRTVRCWDPMANKEMRKLSVTKIDILDEYEIVINSDVVLILLPISQLNELDWSFAKHSKVVDFWRVLSAVNQTKAGEYISVGSQKGSLPIYRDLEQQFLRLTN